MAKKSKGKSVKASHVKGKASDAVTDKGQSEEPSIIERAKAEKLMSRSAFSGDGKKYTREVFKMWLVLPDQFKGAPERITELLGITDPIALELLKIPTMTKFAEEFGVIAQTLSRWRNEIEDSSDFAIDVKKGLRKITRNVLGAFYRKALDEGDAQRVKLWLQYVEDWREQLGVEHTGHISNLTEEEKIKMDKMLALHTK